MLARLLLLAGWLFTSAAAVAWVAFLQTCQGTNSRQGVDGQRNRASSCSLFACQQLSAVC
jgi:hypothetical protein